MKSLIVMIRCDDYSAFHVLIGAIMNAKNEGIEILKHEQEETSVVLPKRRQLHRSYANGIRNKGITGKDLILQILKNGAVTVEELRKEFARRGFAEVSAHSASSILVQKGQIIRDPEGKFHLTGK